MTTLRALRKLVLGETWLLPGGLCVLVAAALLIRSALHGAWTDAGGFILLAGVSAVLLASVWTSAPGSGPVTGRLGSRARRRRRP
jgi:hypothetical protein